jgi:tRNA-modifying protein YgfZ
VELSDAEYEILRLEAGLPAAGHELTEEYTPLETGLEQLVSTSKGCYTGQEVLARQVNYDKVTRHLAGLRLKAEVPAGSSVTSEGKPAGIITSIAISPRLGPIALAVLRRPYHEPGTAVSVGEIKGTVEALPFNSKS